MEPFFHGVQGPFGCVVFETDSAKTNPEGHPARRVRYVITTVSACIVRWPRRVNPEPHLYQGIHYCRRIKANGSLGAEIERSFHRANDLFVGRWVGGFDEEAAGVVELAKDITRAYANLKDWRGRRDVDLGRDPGDQKRPPPSITHRISREAHKTGGKISIAKNRVDTTIDLPPNVPLPYVPTPFNMHGVDTYILYIQT